MDDSRERGETRVRTHLRLVVLLVVAWLTATGLYQSSKPLPPGIPFRGAVHTVPATDITFLSDLTWRDDRGVEVREQAIFDTVFDILAGAESYILADAFLFNPFGAEESPELRGLSGELTDLLVEKRRLEPAVRIDLITDPINEVYAGTRSEQFERLRAAGVNVVMTDLRRLRDSNPLYSAPWRAFVGWLGNSEAGGLFPHPFSRREDGVTLRSWLAMLNFKANHRKLFVADGAEGFTTIVASANPHDGSARHSNVALAVRGDLWRDALSAEEAVARFSGGWPGPPPEVRSDPPGAVPTLEDSADVALVGEGAIKEEVLTALAACGEGDDLWLAMFYLSDREVIAALVAAADRGARVRVVLDPNRDAFGFEKNGVPNRPVARELLRRSGGRIAVRWFETHGEQFHAKMLFADHDDGRAAILLGSANFTRRNLESFNLELDLAIRLPAASDPAAEVREWFERIWENRGGRFTADYAVFADEAVWKTMLYRLQERLGLSSF